MIIYAPNVHQGGGKVLLESLLTAHPTSDTSFILFSDARLQLTELPKNVIRLYFNPSFIGRLKAEIVLWKTAKSTDTILCFGNLPPLFFPAGKIHLFFQNSILLQKYANFSFPWRTQLKHKIERLWIKLNLFKIQTVIVQSLAVKNDFQTQYPSAVIKIWPFFNSNLFTSSKNTEKKYDYLYVASTDPHKNHKNLFAAWEILADKKVYPRLAITLPHLSSEMTKKLEFLKAKDIQVTNIGGFNYKSAAEIYASSKALIFPSFTESFGLPLIEAQTQGLDILASELDYVREFVNPTQSFDPHSPLSIARAVLRHLGHPDKDPLSLLSPEDFYKAVMKL